MPGTGLTPEWARARLGYRSLSVRVRAQVVKGKYPFERVELTKDEALEMFKCAPPRARARVCRACLLRGWLLARAVRRWEAGPPGGRRRAQRPRGRCGGRARRGEAACTTT